METRTVVTEFMWKLEDFKKRFLDVTGSASSALFSLNGGLTASSGLFSLNGGSTAKFQVQISGVCCIHLFCQDFGQEKEIKLAAIFWIESGGNKFGEFVQLCTFKKVGNITKSEDFLPGVNYNKLVNQIKHGDASVCLEIRQEVPTHEVCAHENVKESILSLHEDPTLITIKTEDKEIKIFKYFLVHHSEIFEKMLTMQTSIEAHSGIITMNDVTGSIIEAMRDWMYMGKIENFDELSSALFKLFHKYMIVKLKEKCVNSMCRGLTWQTVPKLLILAHTHNEDLLKKRTLEFIQKDLGNLQLLLKFDDWMKLNGDNPELVKEIVDSIYSL